MFQWCLIFCFRWTSRQSLLLSLSSLLSLSLSVICILFHFFTSKNYSTTEWHNVSHEGESSNRVAKISLSFLSAASVSLAVYRSGRIDPESSLNLEYLRVYFVVTHFPISCRSPVSRDTFSGRILTKLSRWTRSEHGISSTQREMKSKLILISPRRVDDTDNIQKEIFNGLDFIFFFRSEVANVSNRRKKLNVRIL